MTDEPNEATSITTAEMSVLQRLQEDKDMHAFDWMDYNQVFCMWHTPKQMKAFETALNGNSTVRRLHFARQLNHTFDKDEFQTILRTVANAPDMPLEVLQIETYYTVVKGATLVLLLKNKRALKTVRITIPVEFSNSEEVHQLADALVHHPCLEEFSLYLIQGEAAEVLEQLLPVLATIPTLTTLRLTLRRNITPKRPDPESVHWHIFLPQLKVLGLGHWGFDEPFILELLQNMQKLALQCPMEELDLSFSAPGSITETVQQTLLKVIDSCPILGTAVVDGDTNAEWKSKLHMLLKINGAGRYRFVHDEKVSREECGEILIDVSDDTDVAYSLLRQKPSMLVANEDEPVMADA
jgi:hypothetical protein